MKELGEYLKETRENNGVSIDEAADDLNIDSFLLENLEEGNVRAFRDVLSMKEKVKEYAAKENSKVVIISAKIEEELSAQHRRAPLTQDFRATQIHLLLECLHS